MAFNFKVTRYSAIAQIVLGSLLVIFGIADRATMFIPYNNHRHEGEIHTESVVPIWMGIWIVVTGVIGFFGTQRRSTDNGRPSRALIGTYLGFSAVAVVFAGAIITMYSIGIANAFIINRTTACDFKYNGYNQYFNHDGDDKAIQLKILSFEKACRSSLALASMVIIFAILEIGFGILASAYSCKGCCCCGPSTQQGTPQMGQVIYIQTPEGPTAHIMTQGANGVPVAVPVQVNAVPQPQVIYQSLYTAGAAGGGAANAQAPPLETKHRDMPPIYQP